MLGDRDRARVGVRVGLLWGGVWEVGTVSSSEGRSIDRAALFIDTRSDIQINVPRRPLRRAPGWRSGWPLGWCQAGRPVVGCGGGGPEGRMDGWMSK